MMTQGPATMWEPWIELLASWLWPTPTPVAVDIWGVNQQTEVLSLSLSLCPSSK